MIFAKKFPFCFAAALVSLLSVRHSFAQSLQNSPFVVRKADTLRFPLIDRRGDRFSVRQKNPFDLVDTAFVKEEITYNPITKQYEINEKIGNGRYRNPSYLTFKEMYLLEAKKREAAYFKARANILVSINKPVERPKTTVYNSLFDRIFGASDKMVNQLTNGMADKVSNAKKTLKEKDSTLRKLVPKSLLVDIRPQGSVDLLAGYQGQKTLNPTLPERARSNGGFDFNMNTNLQVQANIGDKLKLPINYNTLANFDYLNQLKFDYKGKDDEMIKSIEAGNIAWQSKGTLMPSAQNLFGLKTQLQFGKLFVTGAIASQRSQRQNQTLKGGTATTNFQKKLDEYEENKHFLLAQYFNSNYNKAMSNLPQVNSQVQIQRIEVWITNKTGTTTDARTIVGLADLGESKPANAAIQSLSSSNYPFNGANSLYAPLNANRDPSAVTNFLLGKGLTAVNDFEKTFARKLNANEYFFNPQIGFVSLNSQLQPDEVLAVAYQYTANGRVYQVGEFSQDVALDTTKGKSGIQKVLFLKLLKATSARTNLPIWRLMMKNVYSLDLASVSKEDFKLNVLYEQPSGGLNRYLPESAPSLEGKPLISVLNLDRLNNRNDPQPDGVFDYLEGYTVLSQQGKIIFPVLEPFGRDLDSIAFKGMPQAVKDKYVYRQLYDSIKAIAQTYANLNRFTMQGQAKGTGAGSEIYLGAFNIPQGSVKVNAGGQLLTEGVDFLIDYNLGSVKIINQAIINSGVAVNVSFENNAQFGMQQRGFSALRADYIASKKLTIGGSMVRLNERPFFTKVGIGEDPIRNTMYGADFTYKDDFPSITRLLNKLPFYATKTMSTLTAYGEMAYLKPGHPPQIGSGENGLIYVDDFESARSSLDLRFPMIAWTLASTPQGSSRFPEATLTDDLAYGKKRAKLAWYNIEPNMQDKNSTTNPLRRNVKELSDPRVRLVYTNELFPQQTTNITNNQTTTFDVAYYPSDLGPYNFETSPLEINANGKFKNPKGKWGGMMRAIDQTDFETNNFEFVEMWVQDPFIANKNATGGKLFLNFGNISEDILKDGKRFFENGMNTPLLPSSVDSSNIWGKTPVNPIQVTNAFSNNAADRPYQDVGFDGLTNEEEQRKRKTYLNELANNFGTNSPIYLSALKDPSNDDYVWYRDNSFDASGVGILGRYKNFNNPQGNSPTSSGSSAFAPAATMYPDNEDLNRDNTLNETEEYYEYQINIRPNMSVGSDKYVTDRRTVTVKYADGTSGSENWFLLRVPLKDYTQKVGQIPDFKSIRFVRMYLTDFEDSTVLRFAKLDLVRNNWRQFIYNLDTIGAYTPITNSITTFNTLAVNLEENGSRTPVNYLVPPGIERVQILSNNGVNLLQNEQAMSIQVRNLKSGDARAVFKTLNLDFRQYGKLSMFAHAENMANDLKLKDGDLNLVVRLGQDFLNNYYEIKIPLKVTPAGRYVKADAEKVWPTENNLDFTLQDLIALKLRRNSSRTTVTQIYREIMGNKTVSVMGNPNLGEVKGILIGVENSMPTSDAFINAEVWVNELRLSNINETGAYAALGRVDVQLADLGKLSVSGNMYTQGWGTIEQKIGERARDNFTQFDAALSIDGGKLLPKEARLKVPIYASINKTVRKPEYDPYDKDVKYADKLSSAKSKAQKDSIKAVATDQTTIKTINFTNVRVQPKGRPSIVSISNFDVSYSYTITTQSSPLIAENLVKKYRAGVGYTYNNASKYVEPFKKIIKSRSQWFNLLKDVNFNLKPSLLSFRSDINRQFGQYVPRIVNTDLTVTKVQRVDTTFDKYFTFDRFYNMRWDISRSVNLDFTATNNARVDEPNGAIDTKEKKDSLWKNFFNGGRNTQYTQKASINYNIPLSKLPLTDWIMARYSYGAGYNWIAASHLAISLGNTIENTQENNVNAEFDFTRLYSKSKWLRNIDNMSGSKTKNKQPNNRLTSTPVIKGIVIRTKAEVLTDPKTGKQLTGKDRKLALRKWREEKRDARMAERLQKRNQPLELGGAAILAGKVVTVLKRVSANYSENFSSRIPGYMDSTQMLGQNFKSRQPGLAYVFGRQPDTAWLNAKGAQGLITRDSTFNSYFRQTFTQKFTITAQIEPIKELMIDISFDKSFSKEYTQLYKDTLNNGSRQQHLSPYAAGGFSVSYISFATLFKSENPNVVSATFKEFENNRMVLSNRTAQTNPYWQQLAANERYTADGYAKGYGRYSQDVLIPAFIAAYTGKDPNTIALIKQSNKNVRSNPLSGIIPKPNWRITYTGLTKIPALQRVFSNIALSHSYSGTLSMNSFTSALNYYDPLRLGSPSFLDTVSGNYVPFFLLPNLTMQESFSPLLGIDIQTTKQVNIKFEYKKSRQLSLSLVDYQLSQTNSTEWTFGFGYRKKGLRLPFKIPFTDAKKLNNDLSIKFDISMRNDATTNSRLDQENAYGTGGQKVITIQPSIDYVLSSRVNLKLYFDQRRATPYISTSAPTINTRAGFQVRISLAP